MRRLWLLLPILLTACSGDLVAPGVLGGPMGRFGHTLSGESTSPSPLSTPREVVAAIASPTPSPRPLVATPMPEATASPKPVPTVVPYSPAPDPTGIVVLSPAPATPTPSMPPHYGLEGVTVDRTSIIFMLYDDADEDGDRVRVELNGEPVPGYTDVHLTNAGTYMTLQLRSGANMLRFTALDEGEGIPCTFGLRLSPYVLVNGSADQYSRDLHVGESDSLTVYAP